MSDNASIGRIKYFDPQKGYGYILTEGTSGSMQRQFSSADNSADSIYFSVKDVVSTSVNRAAPLNLHEGQWVQFVIEDTKVGPKARQITLVSTK